MTVPCCKGSGSGLVLLPSFCFCAPSANAFLTAENEVHRWNSENPTMALLSNSLAQSCIIHSRRVGFLKLFLSDYRGTTIVTHQKQGATCQYMCILLQDERQFTDRRRCQQCHLTLYLGFTNSLMTPFLASKTFK
jgi:hypothetical protein